jgi:hypothetical protein
MKTSILAAGLTLTAWISAFAGTVIQSKPQLAPAPNASTRQLVERFVDAYSRQDTAALSGTITRDFTARLYVTQPLSHITFTADALARSWRRQVHSVPSADAGHAPVAIYSTPQSRTLFVTYHVAGQSAGAERIALVELRGPHVAQINDFLGSSDAAQSGKADRAVAAN